MAVSCFELFKIGIGPSSSHTVGPMRAARQFALTLKAAQKLAATARLRIELFGSLGATGKGHGSDKAVLLGLAGFEPDSVDVNAIPVFLDQIRSSGSLTVLGETSRPFDISTDLVFNRRDSLPMHPNGMRFAAFDASGTSLLQKDYYSVGGGFVVTADEAGGQRIAPDTTELPLVFHSGDELLEVCQREGLSIAGVMRINERHWRDDAAIDAGLLRIWDVMQDCVRRGCASRECYPAATRSSDARRACIASSRPTRKPHCATSWWCSTGSIFMRWQSMRKTPPAAGWSLRQPMALRESSPQCCITTAGSFLARPTRA